MNKPAGLTSAQVVGKVKRALNLDKHTKIGHMGTLDKLASGVLPLAIGRATRLFDFMLTKRKFYRAEFTFGYQTDTLDCDGVVVAESEIIPTIEQLRAAVAAEFLGEIDQIPPAFSAKNINGQRASDLMRQGKSVELKPARITIYKFDFVEAKNNQTFVFDIECSAGTYIRSLCRDLAAAVGSVATMTALVRTRAGVFTLDNSINLGEVSAEKLLPADIVLGGLERLDFDTEKQVTALLNGQKLTLNYPAGLYAFYACGILRGLCEIDEAHFARMKTWL